LERYVATCKDTYGWSVCVTRGFASLISVCMALKLITAKHFIYDEQGTIVRITGVCPRSTASVDDVRSMLMYDMFGTTADACPTRKHASTRQTLSKRTETTTSTLLSSVSDAWDAYQLTLLNPALAAVKASDETRLGLVGGSSLFDE
jgi:hypothetical protein